MSELRRIRKNKGLSIRKLSRKTGVSNAYISQLETSQRNPTPKILKKLAEGLETDFDYLFYEYYGIHMGNQTDYVETIEKLKEENQKLKRTISEAKSILERD